LSKFGGGCLAFRPECAGQSPVEFRGAFQQVSEGNPADMTTTKIARMTIEELRQQECYLDLRPKQRMFIEGWIASGGDRVFATSSAYDCAHAEAARSFSYEVLSSPAVIACLAAFYQDNPLAEFKDQVSRAVRNRNLTTAQIRALELMARLNGWGDSSLPSRNGYEPVDSEEPSAPKVEVLPYSSLKVYKVGDFVRDQDASGVHIGLVESINAKGQPSKVVEVQSDAEGQPLFDAKGQVTRVA
jgi:hypothetical protein